MKVLICNERFLFRFGADRTMVLLGKHLARRGHRAWGMANRSDRRVVAEVFSRIIDIPANAGDYSTLDEFTRAWLEQSWEQSFGGASRPDVAVVGGWPFFSSIPLFRSVGVPVVFMDHGAVPLDGHTGPALEIQRKLRHLRKQNLPAASSIVAVSDFIARSQSRPDVGGPARVDSVLWGADHVETPTWSADRLDIASVPAGGPAVAEALTRQGRKTILALGRWEPGCYKNSEAALDLLARVRATIPGCALLVLEEPANVDVPEALRESVFPIGFPDDIGLVELMKRIDLGISVSRWEGFNLPLAEMQWLGRPALVFDLGAHPEVVAHPWFLCHNIDDMAAKACALLGGGGLDAPTVREALNRFRDYFRWSRVADEYDRILGEVARDGGLSSAGTGQSMTVLVDVTNATRDPANPGVIRVTRRICRELQLRANPAFVVWDEALDTYVFPTEDEYWQLAQFNGPSPGKDAVVSRDGRGIPLADSTDLLAGRSGWMLLSETLPESRAARARRLARTHGLRVAAIFYDAIPVLHPEWCHADFVATHADYMRGLAECDLVVPISRFSGQCLEEFWTKHGLSGCPVRPILLPGEFGGAERCTEATVPAGGEVRMLFVSTLEPRKNHLTLIRACLRLSETYPELNWSLTLVGNRYAGAFHIAESVEAAAAITPRIRWLGIVDDVALHRLYRDAWFTVYPSLIEGFGMPILESLWHGRPCICSTSGALGELAGGGGCLTVDTSDEAALTEAIYRLARDRELLRRLTREAVTRPIKTWDDYMTEFVTLLETESRKPASPGPAPPMATATEPATPPWHAILYRDCLLDRWQMSESERVALTGLLARLRPRCAIEIGTYEGGSLSLLSQFAGAVFSIDIDPEVPAKLPRFGNVSFLTGPSSTVLPLLLRELDAAELPVDFVLIDADHTADGVRGDIDLVLAYVPKTALFVAIHDSFNPECRRGILEAGWTRSPYVHWIDVDFVPGRIVEDDGPFRGQLWGGLALAYLAPAPRRQPLGLQCSAVEMFAAMCAYTSGRR